MGPHQQSRCLPTSLHPSVKGSVEVFMVLFSTGEEAGELPEEPPLRCVNLPFKCVTFLSFGTLSHLGNLASGSLSSHTVRALPALRRDERAVPHAKQSLQALGTVHDFVSVSARPHGNDNPKGTILHSIQHQRH
jgi:hypothetical protein